jgi:transcription-repair coupling factor (superfamily II helicase)
MFALLQGTREPKRHGPPGQATRIRQEKVLHSRHLAADIVLSLDTQLDDLETEEQLNKFALELQDRFGPIPSSVEDLFTTLRCRTVACELGFEKLIIKNEQMRLYFVSNPDSPYFESETFNYILLHIQARTTNARLKQVGKNFLLVVDRMKKMKDVLRFLEAMVIKETVQ